ncbi:MAG: hypothetical protein ACYCO5_10305 [Acidobacteriaceae bacterium]
MKIQDNETCQSLLAQQEGALRGYRVRIGNRVKLRGYSEIGIVVCARRDKVLVDWTSRKMRQWLPDEELERVEGLHRGTE